MVVYLPINKGGYEISGYPYLSFILSIARQSGWKPEGVEFDDPFGDPMDYFSNSGRIEKSTNAQMH